jgi:hypothetical protein
VTRGLSCDDSAALACSPELLGLVRIELRNANAPPCGGGDGGDGGGGEGLSAGLVTPPVDTHSRTLRGDALAMSTMARCSSAKSCAVSFHPVLRKRTHADEVNAAATGSADTRMLPSHARAEVKTPPKVDANCTAPSLIPTGNGNTVRSFSSHGQQPAA